MILLFALLLFHHDGPPKSEVLEFTRAAETQLQTYRDGSPESWLEAEQIMAMEQQIEYLAAHPRCRYAKQLEEKITDEMAELYAFDQDAQQKIAANFPDTSQL